MEEQDQAREFERRTFLKRAGIVAGATVWATPTIQSMTSAAFAAQGSPIPGNCPANQLIRFKYNVGNNGGGAFDSGTPGPNSEAGKCLQEVDNYYNTGSRAIGSSGCFSSGGCTTCVTVTIIRNANGTQTAKVTVSNGSVSDVDIKGGSSNGNGNGAAYLCKDGDPSADGSATVTTAPGDAGISFVGGVICPECP